MNPTTRFLLIRTDKIGDVILTTPALSALRKKYPEAWIGFLCRSYTAPVLENNPNINIIHKIDSPGFLEEIKKQNYDVSIHFYVDTPSVLAAWKAKIPVRIGPFSKLSSLLLNKRIRQNRSKVEKHEAEYNLDLVQYAGADAIHGPPEIFLTEEEKKAGREIVLKLLKNPDKKPIIIHPGSAGSVQNWPIESFLELSHKLAGINEEIIFTGGKGEESILERAKITYHTHIHVIPAGRLTLRQLCSVIAQAKLMISNSTGPLHIASALGVPTLSFYPNVPIVTSAKRWGPYGNPKKNKILSPVPETAALESISVSEAFKVLGDVHSYIVIFLFTFCI